eukprot:TRINITY_DN10410_c0_g1_i1.p1 TRINITY_DN10410_c0_g1~~TRINITY_DN10410_c0_g1_i1.p1  ORF type:complete len:425 (-),score=78.68 TRINITY_DN10410_c0_g1_i1:489-1763(-)
MLSTKSTDRFIPNRNGFDVDVINYHLRKENTVNSQILESPSKEYYRSLLKSTLLPAHPQQDDCHLLPTRLFAQQPQKKAAPKRVIPTSCERIHDAPDFVDDYYLNLLDWNDSNILAIGLGPSIFLWNANTSQVSQLMSLPDEDSYITSLAWSASGHLAIGTSTAIIEVWDITREKCVRKLTGHSSRVVSLSWKGSELSSGSRDGLILHHDVNTQEIIASLRNHTQEVCGLKWSCDGSFLASGGNDNLLNIWTPTISSTPKFTFDHHTAAVKALAWCPYLGSQHILASGGGTADGHIRLWSATTGQCLKAVDSNSQVCSLQWGSLAKELISSHGYSKNEICVWNYPSMTPIAELTGHSARVLHTATSPDGKWLASLAADETLRFWKLFEDSPKSSVCGRSNLAAELSKSVEISGTLMKNCFAFIR